MKRVLGIFALLLLASSLQAQSALSTLAGSLTAHQWGPLITNGRTITASVSTGPDAGIDIQNTFNLANPHQYAAGGNLAYDTKLAYDQARQVIYVYGGIHDNGAAYPGWYCPGETHQGDTNAIKICAQFFQYIDRYDIATNRWSIILDSVTGHHSDGQSSRHGDNVLSLDPATGDIYYEEKFGSGDGVFTFPFSTQTWSLLSPGNSAYVPSGNIYSMEWFPEANGLVVPDVAANSLVFYDKTTNAWSSILTGFPANDYPIALYNSFNHNMLVWGGGQGADGSGSPAGGRQFWIITRESGTWKYVLPDGTTTTNQASALRTVPLVNECGSGFASTWDATGARGMLQVDPHNGHYVLETLNASCVTEIWDYDPSGDSWTRPVATTIPVAVANNLIFGAGSLTPAVALPDYGVIFYLNYEPSNQGFSAYLYKNSGSGSGGDTTPPTTPTNLHTTATTATTTEMMWTASTDNVAVTGYTVSRSTNGGSTFTQLAQVPVPIFNDTGLTPNTSYLYKVTAFDAASNVSPNSGSISVTTSSQVYTYVQKCALAGVIKCRAFDNQSELVYGWPSVTTNSSSDAFAGTICDTAIQAAFGPGLPNRRNSFLTVPPYPTPFANTRATVQNGNCIYPVVDNTISHSGGGSLKMTTPSHSTQEPAGEFAEPIDLITASQFGYLGPDVGTTDGFGTSVVHLGDDAWFQWYQRFDTGMIWQGNGNNVGHFDSHDSLTGNFAYFHTGGAGSLTVIWDAANGACDSTHRFPSNAAGRNFWSAFEASNLINYTSFPITAVASDGCSLTTQTSMSPLGTGGVPNLGFGFISNPFPANPGSRTDGFKQFGVFGNPSIGGNGTCCAPATQLSTNGDLLSIPREYSYDPQTFYYGGEDNRGCPFTGLYDTTLYTEPPCIRFKTNQWMEFTVHIHQVGRNCEHNSTFEKWVDGQKTAELTTFALCNGSLAGLGQYNLNPYQTQKDPNQPHADTYSWWDDVIISSQPIPMGSADVPTSCTAPDHLLFTSQPVGAALGGSLGTIIVSVVDSSGTSCSTNTSTITLAKHAGTCTGMTLNGTVSGANLFTTTNVNMTGATGSCSLDASDGILTGATSNSFTISASACVPSKLAFTSQPSDANIGALLGTVSVAVQDSGNNVCGGDTSTITIANKGGTCTGMTLGGTKSGTNQFSTSNLTENAAGTCTLHATDGVLTAADSAAFNISSVSGGPISLDAAVDLGVVTSATSLIQTATIGSSANLAFVGIVGDSFGVTNHDDITQVRVGNATAILVQKLTIADPSTRFIYLYCATGFTTGPQVIEVDAANAHYLDAGIVTYNGTDANCASLVNATNRGLNATSLTTSVTPNSNNAWTLVFENGYNGGPAPSAGTNSTLAVVDNPTGLGQWGLFDSGPVNPVASHSQQTTRTSSGTIQHIMVALDVANGGGCVPHHLAFTAQPSSAGLGLSLGAISVSVEDSGNNVCSTDISTITLSKRAGTCTGMTLNGTASGTNVFTTSGLTLTGATGSCSLDAADGALTGATSSAFTISGCTPDHLAFTSVPAANVTAGASLGTVAVAVQDSGNNVCQTDTSTITIANKAGTCAGMTLGGTLTGTNVFLTANLTESTLGICTLHATDGALTSADSNPFNVTTPSRGRSALRRR